MAKLGHFTVPTKSLLGPVEMLMILVALYYIPYSIYRHYYYDSRTHQQVTPILQVNLINVVNQTLVTLVVR